MKFILMCLIFIIIHSTLYSQTDSTKFPLLVITLFDNTEYVGKVTSSEPKFLNFTTREKIIVRISKDQIKDVVAYEDSRLARSEKEALIKKNAPPDTIPHPEYTDANLNRLVVFPTARPMKSWQWYIQLNELFFPFAAVGIGNFFTIGGGMSLLPGAREQMVYLSPKFTPIHSENLAMAAGIFYMTSTHFNTNDYGFAQGLGVVYTMTTVGDKNKNLTVGLGWGFSGERFTDKPVLVLGGDIKIGRNLKLIAETWTPFSTNYVLGIIGFRVIGEHLSGDFVAIRPLAANTKTTIVPWFNLTYNFGYE